jgi:hypothetical protein
VTEPQQDHRADGGAPLDELDRLVRPYVVTRGRTQSAGRALPIETMVVAAAPVDGLPASVPNEAAVMLRLCREPMSIAELAARARVPVGVARILVADLEDLGVVTLGRVADDDQNIALLERMLDGIRAL